MPHFVVQDDADSRAICVKLRCLEGLSAFQGGRNEGIETIK